MNERVRASVDAALGTLFTACVVRVERGGARESYAAGTLCPDPEAGPDAPCLESSLFDLASLTKLATTALVLLLVRDRQLTLETPLREIVPDFKGPGKDRVTLGHVITHTAGLRWWLPLYQEAGSAEEAMWRAAQEPLAHSLGTYVYSDLGYVMLRGGLERATGEPFQALVQERVLGVVGADDTAFGPRERDRCAATERDAEWRRRRLRGEVHDENAHAMGGVSGHAGLFGTAADLLALIGVYRDGAVIGNELAHLARAEHVRADGVRRGLGLMLRPREGLEMFSEEAFGHTGFTGVSTWVDPAKALSIAVLTNRVYFGRDNADELYRFRLEVYRALAE